MKEIILHYLWLHKRIDVTRLFTTQGEKIQVLNFGYYQQTSGPDFFNAQLIIGHQKWAGTIEMHSKSSDWYAHQHENDSAYDNVILHVVWVHDVDVYRKDNSEIPVLELKNYISTDVIQSIERLLQQKKWIYCEHFIGKVEDFKLFRWKERMLIERLEEKQQFIETVFLEHDKNWEAVCFSLLAKNFGLNRNGELFFQLAQAIPFSVIQKERHKVENLEALFFGVSNLLENEVECSYKNNLKTIWNYQKVKYRLAELNGNQLQFFKLRPDNFPTIRLAQLASLWHQHFNLFSEIMLIKSVDKAYSFFKLNVSDYWQNHYHFGKVKKKSATQLSHSFIDLLLINTVIPLQFAYQKYLGNTDVEFSLELLSSISSEKNTILENFDKIGVKSENAFDSQSLLFLKKKYCDLQKCLQCEIGQLYLKN